MRPSIQALCGVEFYQTKPYLCVAKYFSSVQRSATIPNGQVLQVREWWGCLRVYGGYFGDEGWDGKCWGNNIGTNKMEGDINYHFLRHQLRFCSVKLKVKLQPRIVVRLYSSGKVILRILISWNPRIQSLYFRMIGLGSWMWVSGTGPPNDYMRNRFMPESSSL